MPTRVLIEVEGECARICFSHLAVRNMNFEHRTENGIRFSEEPDAPRKPIWCDGCVGDRDGGQGEGFPPKSANAQNCGTVKCAARNSMRVAIPCEKPEVGDEDPGLNAAGRRILAQRSPPGLARQLRSTEYNEAMRYVALPDTAERPPHPCHRNTANLYSIRSMRSVDWGRVALG